MSLYASSLRLRLENLCILRHLHRLQKQLLRLHLMLQNRRAIVQKQQQHCLRRRALPRMSRKWNKDLAAAAAAAVKGGHIVVVVIADIQHQDALVENDLPLKWFQSLRHSLLSQRQHLKLYQTMWPSRHLLSSLRRMRHFCPLFSLLKQYQLSPPPIAAMGPAAPAKPPPQARRRQRCLLSHHPMPKQHVSTLRNLCQLKPAPLPVPGPDARVPQVKPPPVQVAPPPKAGAQPIDV